MPLQVSTGFPVDVYVETDDHNDRKRWTRFRRDSPAPPDQFLLRSLNILLYAYHTINADHIHGLLYGTKGRYRRGYRVNPNSSKSRRLRKISRGVADIAGILKDCWTRVQVVSPVVRGERKPGAETEAPCHVATWLDMAAPPAVLPPSSPPALPTPLGVIAAALPSLRGFPQAAATVAAWSLDDPSMASCEGLSATSLGGDVSKKTLPGLANQPSLGLPITLLDDVSKTSFDVSETLRDRFSMKASLDNLAMASPYLLMASTDLPETASLGRSTTSLGIPMTSLDDLSMASFGFSMTWLDGVSSTPLALLSEGVSYGVSNTSPDDISVTSLEISKQPSLDWTSDEITTAAPDSAAWFGLSKSFAETDVCQAGSIVPNASWNCVVRYRVGGSSVACPAEGADGTWTLAKAVVLFSSAGQDKASLMSRFEACGVAFIVAQLSLINSVPTVLSMIFYYTAVRRSDTVRTVALHFARR